MQAKETIEGNKVIAEYMGAKFIPDGVEFNFTAPFNKFQKLYHNDDVKFRSSWDWLMPVWSKLLNDGIDNCLQGEVTGKKYDKMVKSDWHQICIQALATAEMNMFWTGIIEGINWMKTEKNK